MPWQLSWRYWSRKPEDRRHRRINRLRRESRLPSGKTWETFEHGRGPPVAAAPPLERRPGQLCGRGSTCWPAARPGRSRPRWATSGVAPLRVAYQLASRGGRNSSMVTLSSPQWVKSNFGPARHRQDPRPVALGTPPGGPAGPLRPLRSGLASAAGTLCRPRSGCPPAAQAGQLRLPAPRRPGLPAPGRRGSEVLFTLIAERYERRSLGITSNLVFSEWARIFANPMATAAAIDRVVHHSVILEFDVPSYRTNAAQQRGHQEVNP